MVNAYYLGGSPCSGKSTIAELISNKYDFHYFKVDDYLEKYIEKAALNNKPMCAKVRSMNQEQIWMRDPLEQCEEELLIYKEIFEYIYEDLEQINSKNGIITEGAAYLPELMKSIDIPMKKYISITPTKEFQIFHYSKREWIKYVLEECSDKEKAFQNWMNRDALFANAIQQQCMETGYSSFINNGESTIAELFDMVILHFGFDKL